MCGDCNNPFHGLDDDLDDVFGGPTTEADRKAGIDLAASQGARLYYENCPSCNGTGNYRGYGACFKCKGTGKLAFKTSPIQRNTARVAREAKADQARIDLQAARKQWIDTNKADFDWMNAKQESFDFARAMYDALMQYGSLTERQHATVTRLRLADIERAAARKVEAEQRAASAPAVSLDKLSDAFAAAQGNGIKKPKLRLDTFKFSLAPAHGVNAGAIYAIDAASDTYLGKIIGGKFLRVRDCTADQESRIVAVCADPKAAAIAYGRRTGNCCICGRELTNHESIELGIGPICAGRMGW